MPVEVVVAVIAAIQAVFVAIIGWSNNKSTKKMEAKTAEMKELIELRELEQRKRHEEAEAKVIARAEIRAEESLLTIQMLSGCLELAQATALAVQEKKINGEMTKAMESADKAGKAYDMFLEKLAANQLARAKGQETVPFPATARLDKTVRA